MLQAATTTSPVYLVARLPNFALRLASGRSGANPARRNSDMFRTVYSPFAADRVCIPVRGAETGGADRFFPVFRCQPKADRAERPTLPGITHSTVKPLALVRWLVRLTTPPSGVVLGPFARTGPRCTLASWKGCTGSASNATSPTRRCAPTACGPPPKPPRQQDHPPRTTAMEKPHERPPYP